ncbi:ABC-type multidrug transport system, ATPase component [Corynebacterium uterequi]|uniref:ABC-type multidrug transport system, ATPase component n=1 Tax=Corynebacterium uterequi TaxID=1072256 RepID=A0A0G3HCS5_9CORY|nr:ABC-type multidrug transport system, ATPase component [Corynebacterium uterequi]
MVKTFGDTTAVAGLNLTVQPGTVFALLGPNGAGKTTTIEMCEGFQKPTSGSIHVLGMDPSKEPELVRERIGIMLQGGGSYSGVSVREMLALAASYSRNPHDPQWLIELLGLESVRTTTYRRLSGGQKQRLSLALALIGRPELVFLDEPTAGMDAQSRLMVWDLISALRRDGVTVVLTTHLMDEAESLADDVAIINRGELVAQGTPAELTSLHTARMTVETAAPLAIDAVRGLTLQQIRPLRYQVLEDPTPEAVAALAEAARAQGVLIRSLDVDHRNLEDTFLELTGRDLTGLTGRDAKEATR